MLYGYSFISLRVMALPQLSVLWLVVISLTVMALPQLSALWLIGGFRAGPHQEDCWD